MAETHPHANSEPLVRRTFPPQSLERQSAFLIAGTILAALVLWQGRALLLNIGLVLILAALIATILQPVLRRLQRLPLPRWLTIFGLYLTLAFFAGSVLSLAVPVVRAEMTQLSDQLPQYTGALQTHINKLLPGLLPAGTSPTKLPWTTIISSLAQSGNLFGLGSQALSLTTGALDLVVILAMSYFFTLESGLSSRLVRRLIPRTKHAQILNILQMIEKRIQKWFGAQLLIGVYFGVVFGTGLALLGLPFAFSIGVIGGVFELFPYIGSVLALVLALLIGIGKSPLTALFVLLIWSVVIEIETHLVAPTLYGRALHLSPLTMLVALFVGFRLLGILGVFLAAPTVIVGLILLDEFYPAR